MITAPWILFVVVVTAQGQITTMPVREFERADDCVTALNSREAKTPPGLTDLNSRVILRGCQILEAPK